MSLNCYKVTVPTTNSSKNTYVAGYGNPYDGDYLDVENGVIYVIGIDASDVAEKFRDAISIERIGIGWSCRSETSTESVI